MIQAWICGVCRKYFEEVTGKRINPMTLLLMYVKCF